MMQTYEDQVFVAEFNNIMEQTAINLKSLSGYCQILIVIQDWIQINLIIFQMI